MPLATFKIAPGTNAEITPAQGMAQIVESQLIRFKFAGNEVLPEKLGGWEKYWATSMGSTPRALHAWEGINADTYLAIGCEESLNVITDGTSISDVTPETFTSTIAPAFTTTSGLTLVQIDDTNITASEFDSIFILVPVSIGGIVLQGAYDIVTVLDTDSYTINAATAATATAGPGGAVPQFSTIANSPSVNVELADHGYSIGMIFPATVPTTVGGIVIFGGYIVQTVVDADNFTIFSSAEAASTDTQDMNGGDTEIIYFLGKAPPPASTGYGIGGYGDGGYGTGSTITPSPGTPITATNWTLDNWGQVLIATPADQAIYAWSPDSGFPVATKIVEAPLINGGAFVAQPEQILVSWASSQSGIQDPLTLNWSDAGDYTNWDVTSQTQAGGYRIPTGSKIMGGFAGPSFNVIWTDLDCWSMDYIGPPFIFGFRSVGQACGLISRHGYASLNSTVYWMSNNKFCRLVGERVETIQCSVWDYVFQNIDLDQTDKIYCGSNSLFGEIWWFFPSASSGTGEVDRYVKFNPDLNVWDFGELARSAWIDQSPAGPPIGASPSGFVYQHEVGQDDDGQPMMSRFKTGFFQVGDGQELQFIDWMLPDFKWGQRNGTQNAIISVSLYFTDYPNEAVKTAGPFTVSSTTTFSNPRIRGRFISVEVASADLGSWWRLGALKFRSVPDGTR